MNPSTSMSAIQSSKRRGRIGFSFLYNFVNLTCLSLCFHLTTILRSDGPSGLGEIIIKSWIFILSVASFSLGIVFSDKQHLAPKPRLAYFFICTLITILLAFFAALGVIEACGDSKGYCRNWQVASVAPNISFKADGSAAA